MANTVRGPRRSPYALCTDARTASLHPIRPRHRLTRKLAPQPSLEGCNDVAQFRNLQGERDEQEHPTCNDNRCAETRELEPERLRGPVGEQEVPTQPADP